jgi:predicted NBD/HSP70 family sugar kinase
MYTSFDISYKQRKQMPLKKMSVSNAMNAAKQSEVNISLVFNFLREAGSSNRAHIAEALKLSIPAVSRAVEVLEESGRIIRVDDQDGTARKGTPVYRTSSEYGYIIAIDLFQNRVSAAIVDFSGNIRERIEGFKPGTSENILNDLFRLIDTCMDFLAVNRKSYTGPLRAIGVGVAAVINQSTGKLQISYYMGLENVQLKDALVQKFKVPVFVENICSLSALAEKKQRKTSDKQTLVFIEVGNGIGSGILLEDSLYKGNGFAGELGFSLTDSRQNRFMGRKKGYLEKQASLSALAHMVEYELSCGVESSLEPIYNNDKTGISPEIIFSHALAGDLLCKSAIDEIVETIAMSLHNLIVILSPEAIVFGGDICFLPHIDELFTGPIRNRLAETLPFPVPDISVSSLGSDSGIIGAAVLTVDSLLMEDFPYHQARG